MTYKTYGQIAAESLQISAELQKYINNLSVADVEKMIPEQKGLMYPPTTTNYNLLGWNLNIDKLRDNDAYFKSCLLCSLARKDVEMLEEKFGKKRSKCASLSIFVKSLDWVTIATHAGVGVLGIAIGVLL